MFTVNMHLCSCCHLSSLYYGWLSLVWSWAHGKGDGFISLHLFGLPIGVSLRGVGDPDLFRLVSLVKFGVT
ncbi:hypothetical protein L1987_15722 [Smallanthus sonchifolius]|uniref:Uncharacterized protein n=1 Tax=Smallanthus sonchifolius TaxID=185202 RepID=A0ACB9J6R6_9ASTR|nr:hypothetical protein L1987_15722 [Smallanthus sonchifolius]